LADLPVSDNQALHKLSGICAGLLVVIYNIGTLQTGGGGTFVQAARILVPALFSAVLLASGCAQLQINQDAFAGRNALQTGKPQDAVGYLRRAIDADPNYTLPNRLAESGLALLGRAYYEIGNLPEARATLEKAVSRDANDNMARLYLGLTLIKAGDPERGRREVETALKGINEWLEYVTSHGRTGVFWDPARAIRSEIQRGLAPGLSVADVVVIAEGVGVKLDAEPEKALRDEINDRDANNNT
jgi:tetratricopeptide (TPR) repeat protein